jgi:hypothetical protein
VTPGDAPREGIDYPEEGDFLPVHCRQERDMTESRSALGQFKDILLVTDASRGSRSAEAAVRVAVDRSERLPLTAVSRAPCAVWMTAAG